jgi:hypothetical protein
MSVQCPDLIIEYYNGETDQVHGRCCIPQVTFKCREGGNPSGPEHDADDREGEQGINCEKDHGHMFRISNSSRPRFIMRSVSAQTVTAYPKAETGTDIPDPTRMRVTPNSSLKIQNGIPMVRLKKSGRVKKRLMMSDSCLYEQFPVSISFWDMVSQEQIVLQVIYPKHS